MNAKMSDCKITFEIEPVVKLFCQNSNCVYNLVNRWNCQEVACNLKHIVIDEGGKCAEMIARDESGER